MKLSFSTNGWDAYSWDEWLDAAEDMKLHGVEVCAPQDREALLGRGGPFHAYARAATVRALRDRGLAVPNLDSGADLSDARCVAVLRGLIALAADLRVPCVSACAVHDDEEAVRAHIAALLPEPIGLSLPASFGAFCLFAVTMLLGVLVLTSLTMLVYTATFYTLSPAGITQIAMVTIEFFSGQLLPLPFYPPVLYKICSWLPFASISNVPFRIYSGDLAGGAMAQAIALQAFWLVALTALGSAWNRRALRRVVVQGG